MSLGVDSGLNERPRAEAAAPLGGGEGPAQQGAGELAAAAGGQPRQAEVGAGEEAQVDGIAVQADVFQPPPAVFVLLGVAESIALHGLYHVILERTH